MKLSSIFCRHGCGLFFVIEFRNFVLISIVENHYENSIEENPSNNQVEALFSDLSCHQNVDFVGNDDDGGIVDPMDAGDVDAIGNNDVDDGHVEFHPSQNSEYSIRVLLPVKEKSKRSPSHTTTTDKGSSDCQQSPSCQIVSVENQTSENIAIFQLIENSGDEKSQQTSKDVTDSSTEEKLTVDANETHNFNVGSENPPLEDPDMQFRRADDTQPEHTEDVPVDSHVEPKEADTSDRINNSQGAFEPPENDENNENQTGSDPKVQSCSNNILSEKSTASTGELCNILNVFFSF